MRSLAVLDASQPCHCPQARPETRRIFDRRALPRLDHLGVLQRVAQRLDCQPAFVVTVGTCGQGFGTLGAAARCRSGSRRDIGDAFIHRAVQVRIHVSGSRACLVCLVLFRDNTPSLIVARIGFRRPSAHHSVSIHLRRAAGVIVRVAHDRACTEVCGYAGNACTIDTSTSSTARSTRRSAAGQ